MAKRGKKKDAVEATSEAQENAELSKTQTKKPKVPKETHKIIVCQDCGIQRTIKVQDAFQVKRCIECQKKYRREQRKQYRKNRIAKLQAKVTELESAVTG